MGRLWKLAAGLTTAMVTTAVLNAAPSSAIVGGTNAAVNDLPAMAGLVNAPAPQVYCGATIVADRYVLTAASCLKGRDVRNLKALVGDHDYSASTDTPYAALYQVDAALIHENYNASTQANDIALARLTRKITFSPRVFPAALPAASAGDFTGRDLTAFGWGTTRLNGPPSTTLQKVNLRGISNSACAAYWRSGVGNGSLCTHTPDRDTCQYDTGGPLTIPADPASNPRTVVGVISHGAGCATGTPTVNTRVTSYLSWIQAHAV